jgi:uncharacterized membrane protein YozB (DUF420 family)
MSLSTIKNIESCYVIQQCIPFVLLSHVSVNNIKLLSVTMAMKQEVPFTLLLSYKIFYTVLLWKHENTAIVKPPLMYILKTECALHIKAQFIRHRTVLRK